MKGEISVNFFLERTNTQGDPFILDFAAQIPAQGITAIYGPSGSGKTTLLRCIAGLEKAHNGYIRVRDTVWQDTQTFLPTYKRSLGYVFQEASLFDHLTVKKNLDYAFNRSKKPDREFYRQVVELMGLEPFLHRHPSQLSGGERQRVAIARTLLVRPGVLLMDEPLASLDDARKREILPYLERIHLEFDFPIFYVTHAMDEVMRLADQVILMDRGKLLSQGNPVQVFSRSKGFFDADEAGVILQGRVVELDSQWHLARMQFDGGELWVRNGSCKQGDQIRVRVQARDVSLSLTPHSDTSILNRFPVEVVEITSGEDLSVALVLVKAGAESLWARITQKSVYQLGLEPGMALWAQIKSAAVIR